MVDRAFPWGQKQKMACLLGDMKYELRVLSRQFCGRRPALGFFSETEKPMESKDPRGQFAPAKYNERSELIVDVNKNNRPPTSTSSRRTILPLLVDPTRR